MTDEAATGTSDHPGESLAEFVSRLWESFGTLPFVVRAFTWLALTTTLLLGVAGGVEGGLTYPIDVVLGVRSAFVPGPWPVMLPLAVLGYLMIPALTGLVVAFTVDHITARTSLTTDELVDLVNTALSQQPVGPGLVARGTGGDSDDDPPP